MNVGTLWRSASIMGANFLFTIGKKYKKQSTDTLKSWKHIPLFNYETLEQFYKSLPYSCLLVGVELHEKAIMLEKFVHPERTMEEQIQKGIEMSKKLWMPDGKSNRQSVLFCGERDIKKWKPRFSNLFTEVPMPFRLPLTSMPWISIFT